MARISTINELKKRRRNAEISEKEHEFMLFQADLMESTDDFRVRSLIASAENMEQLENLFNKRIVLE